MQIQVLKSKIHHAKVTECELYYEGSLGLDQDLMDEAGIYPYEKLLVVNIANGERMETYAIPEERGSKTVCLNGPAARKGAVGDFLIVMAFALIEENEADAFSPRKLILQENTPVQKDSSGA